MPTAASSVWSSRRREGVRRRGHRRRRRLLPIKRALKIDSEYNGYSAIAIRSEMHANRPDSDSLDIYLKLQFHGDQLPGYGWVFPMGNGVFNIGLGYVNSYKNWQSINATQFLGEFLRTLPPRLGPSADRGAEEEQERASVAATDGFHRLAALASGRAVHRRLAGRRQAGLGCGHLQGSRVRIWPPASARSRRCRTAAPTTSPTTRSGWKLRGARSTGAAATSTSCRVSGLADAGIKLIDNARFPRPDAQSAVQEGTRPPAHPQVGQSPRPQAECGHLSDASSAMRVQISGSFSAAVRIDRAGRRARDRHSLRTPLPTHEQDDRRRTPVNTGVPTGRLRLGYTTLRLGVCCVLSRRHRLTPVWRRGSPRGLGGRVLNLPALLRGRSSMPLE